jgi:hypothetical protein
LEIISKKAHGGQKCKTLKPVGMVRKLLFLEGGGLLDHCATIEIDGNSTAENRCVCENTN